MFNVVFVYKLYLIVVERELAQQEIGKTVQKIFDLTGGSNDVG